MALKLITPATALAVTLAEAKAHLRVDGADEDALITALIHAATQAADHRINRAIMPQTWELTLDEFPEALELTRTPVVSVTSVQYVDAAGVSQTLASNLYALDTASDYGFAYVVPAYGTEWPASREQINAVTVRYVAGYAAVPASIKQWILLQVASMCKYREGEVMGQVQPLGFVDGLLDSHRVFA